MKVPFLLVAALVLVVAGCGRDSPVDVPVDLPFVGADAVVVAANLAFAPTELRMPAGTGLRITLQNRDSGVPHNIKVMSESTDIAKSEIVTGVQETEVRFGPLPAGVYKYVCQVHPNMTGALTITP